MIPYFQWTEIIFFGLTVQVWGLLVALGFLVGWLMSRYRAKSKGLNLQHLDNLFLAIFLSSLLVGRLFHVFVYEPGYYFAHLSEIFNIWEGGMSVIGGFVGAAVATFIYLKSYKLPAWPYIDALIFGLPFGLFVGRLGCFFIFDHPGTPTDFFLGQQYLDVVRHNHGFYLALNGLVLSVIFWLLRHRALPLQWLTAFFSLWYGVVRFFLDFLRATDLPHADSRYLSLTPAQYGSLLLVAIGIYLFVNKKPVQFK